MSARDPLALSAAVLKAAGKRVEYVRGEWREFADLPPEDPDGYRKSKLVPNLTRPGRLGKLVEIVLSSGGYDLDLKYWSEGRWTAQWGPGRGRSEGMNATPNVALTLAFLDATGTERPEEW